MEYFYGRISFQSYKMGGKVMMKGRKKYVSKWAVIAAVLSMMLVLTGCGASDTVSSEAFMTGGSSMKDNSMPEMGWDSYTEGVAMEEVEVVVDKAAGTADGSTSNVAQNTAQDMEEKLIKTVDMTVETKEYDALVAGIRQKIKDMNGYIESFNTYNGSMYSNYRSSRSADMTIRIPQDKLDAFVSAISEVGNVVRRSDSVKNVTLQYVDLESHKKALQTEYDRLLQLLEKAESIEDIITIENRLSSVRYQIESMEGQLRTIDNQVSYSTIYLNVDEVAVYTPVVEEVSAIDRIKEGFVNSLSDIGNSLQEFAIGFIINIPYLVIWAVVILVIVLVIRRICKKRKAKKAKLMETKEVKNE